MISKIKRPVSILLSIIMVCSLFTIVPFTASAAGSVASVTVGGTTTEYEDFTAAVNAWTAGSTLKLMTDVSIGATITVPAGEHILDLNGHTLLELSTVGMLVVGNGASSIADLTITDSVGTGMIKHEISRLGSLMWIKEGSSLTLDGGTFEANSSASPVLDFFQQSNVSFTMNGGKITGTANNGAVRFGTNCTFTMTGGEISGLQTSTGVFDYSVESGGSIYISGNPVVKNNTSNGTAKNFNLPSDRVLTINGEMTDGASIGITTQSGPAVFTSGWKANMGDADPSQYFTSDNDSYQVFLNSNGEAEIIDPLVVAKTNATNAVNAINAADYVAADQETVTNAKNTALAAIEAAATEADVQTAITNFNTAIAGCTTQAAADQKAADAVTDLITALPDPTDVTIEDKDAINAAQAAYDALTDDQKSLISFYDTLKLTLDVAALTIIENDMAAAADVKALIDALPAATDITIDDKNDIDAAKEAYDALADTQKGYLDAETVQKLTDVVAALKKLEADIDAVYWAVEAIRDLPSAVSVTIDDKDAVVAARKT